VQLPYSGARVLLVARFDTRDHRSGGALSTALSSLGCEVTAIEERTRGPLFHRDLPARIAAALRTTRPDLVLVFEGELLEPDQIDQLRPQSLARWVNWFPEGPHRLGLSLDLGRAYHRCFVFDSSMVAAHRAAGHHADYLPEGFEPSYHRPLDPGQPPLSRLAFVGSHDEPLRVAALSAVTDLGLEIWGPGWPTGPLYGDDFVRAFARSEVALNVHRYFGEPAEMGRYGTGPNRRVFEIAAIGTVQLCDAKADIARHFRADLEIVLFRDRDELRAKASWLLGAPADRQAIAERARKRSLDEHTWRHRLDELLFRTFR